MSAFDDLLDLGGPTPSGQTSGQTDDLFDPIGQTGTGGQTGGGDALLDLGFGGSVSNLYCFDLNS